MKKKVLAIALVTAFTGMGVAQAADVTAQAVATVCDCQKGHDQQACGDPLGSPAFQYAEGVKGFNSQKGCLTWRLRVTQRLPPLS